MAERVRHHRVAAPDQRGDDADVRHVAGAEHQRRLAAEERRQLRLERLVEVEVAVDEPRAARGAAEVARRAGRGLAELAAVHDYAPEGVVEGFHQPRQVPVRERALRSLDRQVPFTHALGRPLELVQGVEGQAQDDGVDQDREQNPDDDHGHGDRERLALPAGRELGPGQDPGQRGQHDEHRVGDQDLREEPDAKERPESVRESHGESLGRGRGRGSHEGNGPPVRGSILAPAATLVCREPRGGPCRGFRGMPVGKSPWRAPPRADRFAHAKAPSAAPRGARSGRARRGGSSPASP